MNSLSDVGQEKRRNKAFALGDARVQEIITIAKNHTYTKNYKADEYKLYKPYKNQILKETGNNKEMAIVIGKDNKVVFEKLGGESSVMFTEAECNMMKGNKLIHNHPSGSTLSFQDVMLAVQKGLTEIIAFSGKGTYYRLIIKSNKNINELVLKYKEAQIEASAVIRKLVETEVFTRTQGTLEYHHFIMSIFSNSTKDIYYEQTKH